MSLNHSDQTRSGNRINFPTDSIKELVTVFGRSITPTETSKGVDPVTEHSDFVFRYKVLNQETFDDPISPDRVPLVSHVRVGTGPTLDA